jgi:hypothetical protein
MSIDGSIDRQKQPRGILIWKGNLNPAAELWKGCQAGNPPNHFAHASEMSTCPGGNCHCSGNHPSKSMMIEAMVKPSAFTVAN